MPRDERRQRRNPLPAADGPLKRISPGERQQPKMPTKTTSRKGRREPFVGLVAQGPYHPIAKQQRHPSCEVEVDRTAHHRVDPRTCHQLSSSAGKR
jgi:hypothetical protein